MSIPSHTGLYKKCIGRCMVELPMNDEVVYAQLFYCIGIISNLQKTIY